MLSACQSQTHPGLDHSFLSTTTLSPSLSLGQKYDDNVWDTMLVVIVFIGPAMAIIEPILPYLCGKKIQMGTVGDVASDVVNEVIE